MNTCGDEVLPFSPEVINGLKAFKIGLYIAFGLSSLSHVIINNIRRENNSKGNLDAVNKSGGLSCLNLVAVHLVPIGSIILQELNSTHWDSFSEERVHGWEETVTLVVFALIILARSASVGFMPVASVGFFISLYSLLRSADDERVAVVVFGSTLFSFLLLCVVLLRRSSVEPAALWAEQQSGVGVLRGVFLLFVAAQLALYALQRQEIVDSPIAALCAALLAGCVRHVFIVVCTDSHFDHVDANYNMEQSAIEEMEEADQEAEVETTTDEDVLKNDSDCSDCSGGKSVAPKIALRGDTTDAGDRYEEHQHHSSSAWSPSPTQVNLLSDHGKSDRNRQDASSEEQELPGIDAFGSAEFHRSNSTGISEQQRQFVHSDNASRRQLLRYVFHEMRAPLNSISMAVDLLTHHSKKGTPKNKFQDLEALQIIEEAALTMERTLKDTMTLQKIDEGSLVAQCKIFSVHSLCDDIKDALKQVLKSKSVTLNYAVDADVPEQIVGDHFRIRHVVAHVLSNAIKFSRAGGAVEMHVGLRDLSTSVPPSGYPSALAAENRSRACSSSNLAGADLGKDSCSTNSAKHTDGQGAHPQVATEYDLCPSARDSFEGLDDPSPVEFLKSPTEHLADGKYVVISITDSGIGMSSELQESDIFKPFNQLKTEEITGFRGSGLGLAICKKILTFLQGSITYSSVEGAGTTFRISFPLTRLDTASMDEVEEEDLPAIELACNSSDPIDRMLSPKTQQRNRAIAKAKSFRGEKLLSILHNQSNVFDCPTPGSCTASFHFHTLFSSTDESEGRHTRNNSGGSGPASSNLSVNVSASVSGSASNDHTPRSASGLAKGISVSRVPSIAGELEAGESVFRSGGSTPTPPRRAFAASGSLSPSRPLSSSASTLRKLQTVQESRNNSSELFDEDGSNGGKSSPARDTQRDVSTLFHTDSASHFNYSNNAHLVKLADEAAPRLMPGNMPTLPPIQAAMHSSLSHSLSHDHSSNSDANPSSPLSPIAAVSNSQAYVALTEKNVNLHILRTAATDGGFRAVKQTASKTRKSCSKDDLLATLKACKVLVVDDAASNRKLLSMMLKRAGFGTVDLVEDGQAAVDYCTMARSEGDLPKIIFMDNTMPRMTGIEASRIIRQQGGYPHLIIGVTGNSMEEELDDFIAAGVDLVIVKPLKNQSLEMLLGFIQTNGFDSSHGHRIDTVGQEFTWVPRK